MPKLGDLKALLDAHRAQEAARKPASPSPDHVHHEPQPRRAPQEPQSARRAPAAAGHREGTRPLSGRRALAASKHADADVDLEQAFADVRRLPPRNRANVGRPAPPPLPRQRMADEEEALLASKFGAEPALHAWEVGQEHEGEQTFVRGGIGSDVLAKLRRGHWSLQGELDLHGLTSEEARDRLADFLLDARARGARCVRVIHGKGLTSPRKEPVLKGKVRRWLAHWDDVLAYCEAPRHAGGGGAVLILLKGR